MYILKADSYYIQYINYLLSKKRSKSRFPQGITPQDLCIQVFILKLKNNRKEKIHVNNNFYDYFSVWSMLKELRGLWLMTMAL